MSTPDVRLTMPARAEGVAVVRQALAGLADALDFDAAILADMKMAVSEACTNVVVHAYEDSDGMLEVDMTGHHQGLTISVRDHGRWRDPRGENRGHGQVIMRAAMDEVDVRSAEPGTEVVMRRRLESRA